MSFESLESRRLLAGIAISPNEQLLLELVNRARRDPAAEAARFSMDLNAGLPAGTISTVAKQPLAPNQFLSNASALHSQDMLDRDYFRHNSPEGQTPSQRATAAGYTKSQVLENIHWSGSTVELDRIVQVFTAQESLFRSSGHRSNLLSPNVEEIGVGIRYGGYTPSGTEFKAIMVTEKFGVDPSASFITGVAYSDAIARDDFYTVGEQFADVTVRARATNGTLYETITGPSGAYALNLPNGIYDVVFTHPSRQGEVVNRGVVIQDSNVKVDLNLATAVWTQPRTLALSLDRNTIPENAGAGAAVLTVSRNDTDLTQSISVALTSGDTSEVSLPASVVIPAGQSSITVGVNAVDDALFDGTQSVTLEASASGYSSASTILSVTDFQPISLASQFTQLHEENAAQRTTTAQLSLRSPAPAAGLLITLSSTLPSQLVLPATVFVASGESRVEFQISVVDDFAPQGTRQARIQAVAPGTVAASIDLVLSDTDVALWTNSVNSWDVDNNNSVDPLDVLAVINEINLRGQRLLHPVNDRDVPFIDTNSDGRVDPLDVLGLINTINSQ